jgi:acyl-CoA synthetase (AMP-forming)/AMP-acid ligase II
VSPSVAVDEPTTWPAVVERYRGRGDRTAIVEAGTGRAVSYGDLADAVVAERDAWTAWGLRPGEVVALSAPNSIAWLRTTLAVVLAGGVVATIAPAGAAPEIVAQLHRTGARHLVADASVLERVGTPVSRSVLEPDLDGGRGAPIDGPADPDAVSLLMTSSGTTGMPKTAQMPTRVFAVAAAELARAWQLDEADTVLGVLPFSHAAGLSAVLAALSVGARLVTLPRFEPAAFGAALREHGVTAMLLAPPIVRAVTERGALRMIASAGAPLTADVQRAAQERLGVPVLDAYGMTETGWLVVGSIERPQTPGALGRVCPGVELRLVDPDTGDDVEPGRSGELWARSPGVGAGYLGDPAATAGLFTADGWARTGDLGVVGADGEIRLVDRLKDLIKYNGNQVSPTELERLIAGRADVADVAVAPDDDPEAGQIPHAYVVARTPIDPDELMAWVATRVSPQKRVRAVTFVEEIPRLPAGKVLRRLLTAGA